MFTLILLVSITVSIRANYCSSKYYEEIRRDGSSLPPDEIISRHYVEETAEGIKCFFLCTAEPMCVGFNYKKAANKTAENCQLTNVTKRRKTTEKGVWILLHDVEATKKEQERKTKNDCKNLGDRNKTSPLPYPRTSINTVNPSFAVNNRFPSSSKIPFFYSHTPPIPSFTYSGISTVSTSQIHASETQDGVSDRTPSSYSSGLQNGKKAKPFTIFSSTGISSMASSMYTTTFASLASAVATSSSNPTFYSNPTTPLIVSAHMFESNILRGEPLEFTKRLEKWLNKTGNWSICWRSTAVGNTSAEFHSQCDGKNSTLTIVKVIKNNKSLIFGGYATKSWAGNDDRVSAPGSFLFSLRNNDNLPPFKAPLKNENDEFAIQRYPSYGPIFGGGIDLWIRIPGKSSSSIDYTYQVPNITANKEYLLTGSKDFFPKEIEVWNLM